MWLHFSFTRNFSTERQLQYARKTKMHDIIFFQFFKHFWFPLPVHFLLVKSLKLFIVGKILQLSNDHHAGWPLCKLWEHRFSVPDLVSSPPDYFYLILKTIFPQFHLQWNPVNATTVGPLNPGRNNKVVTLMGLSK